MPIHLLAFLLAGDGMDEEIERGLALVDRLERQAPPSPLVARLKSRGLV